MAEPSMSHVGPITKGNNAPEIVIIQQDDNNMYCFVTSYNINQKTIQKSLVSKQTTFREKWPCIFDTARIEQSHTQLLTKRKYLAILVKTNVKYA